jgi:hypothetical protein
MQAGPQALVLKDMGALIRFGCDEEGKNSYSKYINNLLFFSQSPQYYCF